MENCSLNKIRVGNYSGGVKNHIKGQYGYVNCFSTIQSNVRQRIKLFNELNAKYMIE